MEEVMMVADYSQDDLKMKFNDKENNRADTPLLDQSKNKQEDDNKKALRDAENDENKNLADTNGESPSDSESNQDARRKKKHRRRHKGGKNHRRWKPYDKMSWTEKQELEEKETRRATQKREEAFASGHPVAPYNTTQFLMDDHEAVSPDLHRHNSKDSNQSNDSEYSSSEFYDDEENDGFQEKNFMDTFNDIRMQELMNKSKENLVRDYVEIETKLERMEEKRRGDESSSEVDTDIDREEYVRLKEENQKLKKENKDLLAKLDNAKT